MSKYDEEAKKKRQNPVYSNTYKNGGWSHQDSLPSNDPIGDVSTGSKDFSTAEYRKWEKQYDKFYEELKKRSIHPKDKYCSKHDSGVSLSSECCSNPDKYKNIVSKSLKFWSCKNCGADLGDI